MKRFLIGIFCLSCLAACNKKDSANTVIDYLVIANNSSSINVEYKNAAGDKVSATGKDSWTVSVSNPVKPFTAYVKGTSTGSVVSVPTKCLVYIVVNGTLVKTDSTSNNSVATAEIEYTVK